MNMKFGKVGAAVASLVAASLMSASPPAFGSAKQASSAKHYTFDLVTSNTTDPFMISINNGARAEAKKLGASISIYWTGPEAGGASSTSQEVAIVNTLLAKHPDALILDPQNTVALEPSVRKYDAAGIPVICVNDTVQDKSLIVSTISSDNLQGGAEAAESIAEMAHYKGSVAALQVPPGSLPTDQRLAGFLAQMKKYPNMQVAGVEEDQDSATLAETDTKNLVLAHKNLVGVFGTNLYGAEGLLRLSTVSG